MVKTKPDIIHVKLNTHPYRVEAEGFFITTKGYKKLAKKHPGLFNWQDGNGPIKIKHDEPAAYLQGSFTAQLMTAYLRGRYGALLRPESKQ